MAQTKQRTPAQIAAFEKLQAANAAKRAAKKQEQNPVEVQEAVEAATKLSGFAAAALQAAEANTQKPADPQPAQKPEKVTRVKSNEVQEERNGQKRPVAGSKAAKAWAVADAMLQELGDFTTNQFAARCVEMGMNNHTVRQELSYWRRFNGRSIK